MLTKTANVFNYLGTQAKLGFTPKATIRLPTECSPAYNLSRILAVGVIRAVPPRFRNLFSGEEILTRRLGFDGVALRDTCILET
jgi:hypothetical protein